MLILILKIIFWVSLLAIIHPYTTYPLFLHLISKKRKVNFKEYDKNNLPFVSIIMAAYNEELILKDKINSIYKSNYPAHLFEIIVGSDASTDKTNHILQEFANRYDNFSFKIFEHRSGKIKIINNLIKKAQAEIIVLTDADVFFQAETLFELIKYFKDEKIGLVDSNLQKKYINTQGTALQEKFYMNFEFRIKNKEGIIDGIMMGPFGGAYALRKALFTPVPENFLVDDFYINMNVLEKKYRSINNPLAVAYDNGTDDPQTEFNRKVRISTGNFQNLKAFSHFLFFKRPLLSFCFWSHKVLRWIAPMLIILLIIISVFLTQEGLFYNFFSIFLFFSLSIPFIDYFLRKNGFHIILLRYISHFYYMNLGLLIGFFKYLKGVKTNVWKPTKRKNKAG